jgi:hypothetical protein
MPSLGHGIQHDLAHDQFLHDPLADLRQGLGHLVGRDASAHLLHEHDQNLLDVGLGDVLAVDLGHEGGVFGERLCGHRRCGGVDGQGGGGGHLEGDLRDGLRFGGHGRDFILGGTF